MRRFLLPASVLLVAALIAPWCYFSGKDYVVRLGEEDIRQQLDRQLPLQRTYLRMFEVELSHARVQLREGGDRIDIGIDVQLNLRIGRESPPLGGSVDLRTGIRYEPADGGFYLTDPQVTRLDLQGVPAEYAARAQRGVSEALGEFLRQRPVYTLRAVDAKHAGARLLLKGVVVANREVVITLGI